MEWEGDPSNNDCLPYVCLPDSLSRVEFRINEDAIAAVMTTSISRIDVGRATRTTASTDEKEKRYSIRSAATEQR